MKAFLPAPEIENPRGRAKVRPADPENLFLPYQVAWIEDSSRIKIVEKSRQIGFSWATAFRAAARTARKGQRYDTWASSRDEAQARLFLDDVKAFAEILTFAVRDLGERVVDDQGNTALVLRFANGRRLHSLSSNPNAQAGKRGPRILDEFALHPDPKFLYDIALPGITWGGELEIISTHRGSGNFFNTLIRDIKEKGNRRKMSLHTVTLERALSEGFLWKLQQKLPEGDPRLEMDEAEYFDDVRSRASDEEAFLQEYCCQPADDASAFLEYSLLDRAAYPEDHVWEQDAERLEREGVELYAGLDLGRHKDLTVLWVLARHHGRWDTVRQLVLERQTFAAQEAAIYPIVRHCRRVAVDATGLGEQFAERLQERFGRYKVEPVKFSASIKEGLAYPVRSLLEDGALKIPGDRATVADLRSIRRETTAAGNVRFGADRGPDGHADRFWALALAIHAGARAGAPGEVVIPDRTERVGTHLDSFGLRRVRRRALVT